MSEQIWEAARSARAWLDRANGTGQAEQAHRILKLVEEAGEAAGAWIGLVGQNPRKGVTHTRQQVAAELADVAFTALVAIESLGLDSREALREGARKVHTRLDGPAAPDHPADRPIPVRVAVYVVRDSPAGQELLVFDQRGDESAGTQVPAGGVDRGETLEQAAHREVAEETGLTDVNVHASLGVQHHRRPDTGQPLVTVYFLATTQERRDRWDHVVSGDGDDRGMVFECAFVPLAPDPPKLAGGQAEYLAQLDPPAGRG